MRPFSTPVAKESVLKIIESVIAQSEVAVELRIHGDAVYAAIAKLFERCPAIFQDKKFLSNGVAFHTPDAIRTISEVTGVEQEVLKNLRRRVCAETGLVFYERYFEQCINERMMPYCQSHKPPKKWGLGSVFYWDDGDEHWGRAFYSCWRQQIEKTGDEIFRAKILPRLPQQWQDAYELVPRTRKCPYQWKKMSPDEIARSLVALRKKKDPAQTPWWFGVIANEWTGDEEDELWGKSFWSYWRDHVEARGDAVFRVTILPLLPEDWRRNFMELNPWCNDHRWSKMTDEEIGRALGELTRPHGLKKWGLGSASHWQGADGRACGNHFVQFWRRNCEPDGDKIFRARILPHVPEPLRSYYKMVGYEIEFLPPTEEMDAAAQATEDMDQLYALAHAGNYSAFKKLADLLQIFLQKERNIVALPMIIIERIIHMHLPVYGSIRGYAVISGYRFCSRFFQFDDRRSVKTVGPKNEVEECLITQIDADVRLRAVFDFLAAEGIDQTTVQSIVDIFIEEEIPLEDLAQGKLPEDFDETQRAQIIRAAVLLMQFASRQT